MIDEALMLPLKRLGLVDMFNGLDVLQTRDYVKISCSTYIEKISEKHLENWMRQFDVPVNRPTPLPSRPTFIKSFLAATGDTDQAKQSALEKSMSFKYRSAIGELIYALVTCRPDLSYSVVRSAQNSTAPHEIHYHGVRHILKYLYLTRDDGIYFWRLEPNDSLPKVDLPKIKSSYSDLLLDGRPSPGPYDLHGYVDSDWAACPKTRRSITGGGVRLAGGTVGYKTKLQPTIAQSSTEAEFMGASDFGKLILFIRSVMWDLGIPQDAATVLYEDNDACTAMANAQKPTTRTRHMDIKFNVLCEWVEQDLLKLERVDTSVNLADIFTKQLGPTLFNRHVDYLLGHVPPQYSACFKRVYEMSFSGEKVAPSATTRLPTIPLAITSHPAAAAAAALFATWSQVASLLG